MSSDITLLKVFSMREHYEAYIDQINIDILEFEIRDILLAYKVYFEENDKDRIDFTNFFSWFCHGYKLNMPEATRRVFQTLIENIPKADDTVVENIVAKFHEAETAERIRELLDKGFNSEDLSSLLEEHNVSVKKIEDEWDFVSNNLEDILEITNRKDGLTWHLDCLNEAIGPLSIGQLIIIAAYVDVGKTIAAISTVAHMAKQLINAGDCILWLNNEEHNRSVQMKLWRSVLGLLESEIKEYPEEAKQEYKIRMNGDVDRVKLIDIRSKTLAQIKQDIRKHKPKLIVMDQVDKIVHTKHKSFSDHDRLKNLYGEVRAIANEYCSVIAISQADATTTYKDSETGEDRYQLYPHHRQLDGSKVGKPGEADAIIMIGRRHDQNNTRGIHVSKNKFGNTLKKEVIFDGARARYLNP